MLLRPTRTYSFLSFLLQLIELAFDVASWMLDEIHILISYANV